MSALLAWPSMKEGQGAGAFGLRPAEDATPLGPSPLADDPCGDTGTQVGQGVTGPVWRFPWGKDWELTGQQLVRPADGPDVQVCDPTEWTELVLLLRSGRGQVMVVPELCEMRAVNGFQALLSQVAHYGRGGRGVWVSRRTLVKKARLSLRYIEHLLSICVQVGLLIRLNHGARKGAHYLLAAPGGTAGAVSIAKAILERLGQGEADEIKRLRRASTTRATNPRRRATGDPAAISAIGRALIEHNPWLAYEIAKGLGHGGDDPGVIRQGAMQVSTAILDEAGRRRPGGGREKVRDPRSYVRAAFRNNPSRFARHWPGAKLDAVGVARLDSMIASVGTRLRT